ncbi:MAG: HAMP domain-containing protein [Spirochaetia bacterium]|nr:HAMP domain-containing protein [Spirochaetia bacterium]
MRLRLAHKLGMILLATVILSAGISAVIISINTRSAFLKLVRENDIQNARTIADSLETYYGQYRSWEGIGEVLENPFTIAEDQRGRNTQPGMNPMGAMGQMGHMGSRFPRGSERGPLFRVLLADTKGEIIAHTFEQELPESLGQRALDKGIALFNDGKKVGYVFVGSMIEPAFGPFQQAFLMNVYRSILLASLIVGILFPLAGILLMRRHITYPLQQLSEAAQEIAVGHYSLEIDNPRSDEIGELSRSFKQMAAKLSAADKWKRKLIADSAHELRTPVSVLQGNLEMMLEGVYPLNRERISGLYGETLLLKRLVQELQELSHAESASTVYNFSVVDITALLHSVIENFRTSAAAKNIELQFRMPENPIEVYADTDKLRQVITNVLKNAVRYSPVDGLIRIDLSKQLNGTAMCSVEDSGGGIPVDEREKVFERFYRIQQDRNRSSGGSGLGLSIVHEIVLRHDGKVYFEEPKFLPGARLVLELPVLEQSAEQAYT